jgi:uracil-DNA glycosylase
MYGQAPGPREGVERRPWRGDAGRKLREEWLQLDEERFYATFYCGSVTRCDPGRHPVRGDRVPSPEEQQLCAFWHDWELELLRPELIVPVGTLAIKRLLGITGLKTCIGRSYERDGVTIIPLPHPSGASSWPYLNRELTERALVLVRNAVARLQG